MSTFLHSGDLGDIIAALPAIRHLGGGDIHLVDRPWTKAIIPRTPLIAPLLEAQGYITGVHSTEHNDPTFDLSTFRRGGLPWGVTLGALQAVWAGVNPDLIDWTKPWLESDADPQFSGRVVVARSPRYNNHTFPWKQVVDFYGGRLVFIGLPLEHKTFCENFGGVDYHPTKDLWEVATVIKGSELFIGNQSSPFNIAEGLKHPRILECALHVPDCCYGGGEVQYVPDGATILPGVGGEGSMDIPLWKPAPTLDTSITPPSGWIFTMPSGHKIRGQTFDQAKHLAKQEFRAAGVDTSVDIGAELIEQTVARLPDPPTPSWYLSHLENCNQIKSLCPLLGPQLNNTL